MYLPGQFEETRREVLHAHMRANPLATLVTVDGGALTANHIPLRVSAEAGDHGVLHGHVARANPLWRTLAEGVPALAIFQGPDLYISPSLYATKRETEKVVPTWNYAVVHAHGTLRAIDDPAWLRRFLDDLVDEHESRRTAPWKITDAPAPFIDQQLRAIVGIEMVVSRLVGKWKVSQNRVPADQRSTIAGLRAGGTHDEIRMADLIERAIEPPTT